jgi:hypothetical protein
MGSGHQTSDFIDPYSSWFTLRIEIKGIKEDREYQARIKDLKNGSSNHRWLREPENSFANLKEEMNRDLTTILILSKLVELLS